MGPSRDLPSELFWSSRFRISTVEFISIRMMTIWQDNCTADPILWDLLTQQIWYCEICSHSRSDHLLHQDLHIRSDAKLRLKIFFARLCWMSWFFAWLRTRLHKDLRKGNLKRASQRNFGVGDLKKIPSRLPNGFPISFGKTLIEEKIL